MFANRIRELRKQRGMTQSDLAKTIGLSQQAVGKWETGRSSPDQETLQFLADLFEVTVDYLLGRPPEDTFQAAAVQEFQIPIIGTVKAGYDALAFQEDHGTEPALVKNPQEYFYLIVRGDSMEPRITSGDLALVHRQPDVQNGDLAVVLVDNEEGTLKKVIKGDGALILQPFNPKYQAQVFLKQDMNRVSIVGRVVETKSKW